jgi:hypothetical protein
MTKAPMIAKSTGRSATLLAHCRVLVNLCLLCEPQFSGWLSARPAEHNFKALAITKARKEEHRCLAPWLHITGDNYQKRLAENATRRSLAASLSSCTTWLMKARRNAASIAKLRASGPKQRSIASLLEPGYQVVTPCVTPASTASGLPVPRVRSIAFAEATSVPPRNRALSSNGGCWHK